jgi:Ca2+/Na+ antiporter
MSRYWFPAKRYGWGWGFPITWQGWLVLAAFIGLVVAGAFLFPPRARLIAYLFYVAVLSLGLLAVSWLTGEPPRWRWGEDD